MNDGDIIFMPSILLHIVATAIAFIPFPQGSRHSSRAVREKKKEEEPPGASGSHSSFFLYSSSIQPRKRWAFTITTTLDKIISRQSFPIYSKVCTKSFFVPLERCIQFSQSQLTILNSILSMTEDSFQFWWNLEETMQSCCCLFLDSLCYIHGQYI